MLLIAAGGLLAAVVATAGDSARRETSVAPRVLKRYNSAGELRVLQYAAASGDRLINHGPLTVWYDDGQVRSSGHWLSGEKHGLFHFWHPNGRPSRTLSYRHGHAHGTLVEWDPQGHVTRRQIWSHGRRVD